MIDEAFHLFTSAMHDKLLNVCLSHPLFCYLYDPLSAVQEQTGLTPDEVWSEAVGIALKLGQTPRPDFLIKHEYRVLLNRYGTFIACGTKEIHRNDTQTDATRCAVFTTLLYMLASASSVDRNPHTELCFFIVNQLKEHSLYHRLYRDICRSESREEAHGYFAPQTDYTHYPTDEFCVMEEVEMVHIDELIQEAISSHSLDICFSMIHLLVAYNKKHDHKVQCYIDRLHDAIDHMVEEQNSPRIIENKGVINRIENNQGPVNGDVKEQRILMGSETNERKCINN